MSGVIKINSLSQLTRKIERPFKGCSSAGTRSASSFLTNSSYKESPSTEPSSVESSYAESFYSESSYAESESCFSNLSFAESESSTPESIFEEPSSAESPAPEYSLPEYFLLGHTMSPSPEHTASQSSERTASLLLNPTTGPSLYSTTCLSLDIIEPQPRPNGLEHSPFKQLAIETIQLIATFLPLSAAASFYLTCWPARFIIGSQYLDQLRERDWRERLEFLSLLERDLPRHVACHECIKLHGGDQGDSVIWRSCRAIDYKSLVSRYIGERFDSATFFLLMKNHRYGLDCSEQLSLLSGFSTYPNADHIHHWESTPRIVNDHFILRHQTWLLLPAGTDIVAPILSDSCVCPDWYSSMSYTTWLTCISAGYQQDARYVTPHPTKLTRKLACRASHWDNSLLNASCPVCSGLSQCEVCPTEFQIDAKDFSEYGVALIITRWLDLGEGRSLRDDRYTSHLPGYKGNPVPFKGGSIKDAFEGGDVDVEELLTPKYKTEILERALFLRQIQQEARKQSRRVGPLG